MEFDYVGVIIGDDMFYENNKLKTDFKKRSKNDSSTKGLKSK
ncbi:DNA/RNA helicase domain-containing protein [Spiroplasma sabaudiense]